MATSGAAGFHLFDTALGRCALSWGARGVRAVLLPDASPTTLRARVSQLVPDATERTPPPAVRKLESAVRAHLQGRSADFSAVVLDDESLPPFHRRVYEAARFLPPGTTVSYGALAAAVGSPGAARAVGQAMAHNPFAIVVPCHRVVAGNGKLGGFSATGGATTKQRLLAAEGTVLGTTAATPANLRSLGANPEWDAEAVEHLRRRDRTLARLIDAAGPLRLELARTGTTFGALTEAIVYQQLSPSAASTIYGRLKAQFPGRGGITPARVLELPFEQLRAAGLSGAKARAVVDLAERTLDGTVPTIARARSLSDDELVEQLTKVRGVGRWTAEMFLIFRLGRPDVLPVDDYGMRRGFAVTFTKGVMPDKAAVERRAARWRPYRSAASWYLWRAAEGAGSASTSA